MSQDTIELKNDSGSKVTVHLHGATIISWVDRGEEVLFVSKDAIFDNKKAIRGGIPLVFPNFGPWTLGPQHGFARIKRWTVEAKESPCEEEDGQAVLKLSLVDDDETRAMWPYSFKLVYTISLWEDHLMLTLTVSNTGPEEGRAFDFTTLMHTYLNVDIEKTSISGLKGVTYIDKVAGGKECTEERDAVRVDKEYDRIYRQVPDEVKVIQEGKPSTITITPSELPDIVVWNPWADKAKAMGDFGDDEYKRMVCVEAGSVTKVCSLAPGESLNFSQKIAVSKAKSNV